jgi:hypothetical protein
MDLFDRFKGLDYFGLTDKVEVGTVGKMIDIIAALHGGR